MGNVSRVMAWIAIFSSDGTHVVEEGDIVDDETNVVIRFNKPSMCIDSKSFHTLSKKTLTTLGIKITYNDAHVASIITPFDDCEHILLTKDQIYFQINKKAMKKIEEGRKKKTKTAERL